MSYRRRASHHLGKYNWIAEINFSAWPHPPPPPLPNVVPFSPYLFSEVGADDSGRSRREFARGLDSDAEAKGKIKLLDKTEKRIPPHALNESENDRL